MRIVEVIVGRKYKHFKGEYYRVLCIANDSMTPPGEPLREVVIYESLYGTHKFWSRPYEKKKEKVDKDMYPEVTQEYRFELVDEHE